MGKLILPAKASPPNASKPYEPGDNVRVISFPPPPRPRLAPGPSASWTPLGVTLRKSDSDDHIPHFGNAGFL